MQLRPLTLYSVSIVNRKALVNDNFIKFAREKILITPKMSDQEAEMIDKFEDKIRIQCRHRFSYQRTSDEDFIESIGLGTRSADLVNDDAMEVSTSDRRRLSRYHMEDCLRLAVGQTVRLYFKKSAVHDPKGWWNRSYPLQGIIDLQQSESFWMMGEEYYELVATVSQANLNQEVQMGSLSISQFETAYQGVGVPSRRPNQDKMTVPYGLSILSATITTSLTLCQNRYPFSVILAWGHSPNLSTSKGLPTVI
jgi:hypothetical protein